MEAVALVRCDVVMGELSHAWMDSPVGRLLLVAENGALLKVSFPPAVAPPDSVQRDEQFGPAVEQLMAYFDGKLRAFDLPLAPRGTPFQMRVWEELTRIPYGETRSYSEIARGIGRPEAVRAVGASNGANPLPIVVPCHRVIGANGSLTGFGGGLTAKRYLLDLERQRRIIFGTRPLDR
jgi:methylated-DNA-[protein]-cysteine S-methyltransferase